MQRDNVGVLVAAGATAALLVLAGLAVGATGALTPEGCISDVGDPAGCGATQQGLAGVGGIAVAADGRSVYAASVADNAIVRFDCDPATAALTPAGCIADVGAAGCGQTQQGLDGARSVAVSSPDGRSVYVTSSVDAAIASFDHEDTTPPETTPPETTITSGPGSRTRKRRATFEFVSNEPGSPFECVVNGSPFTPCASPFTTEKLKRRRRHTFAVRAIDPVGNIDPTPAQAQFKIKKRR